MYCTLICLLLLSAILHSDRISTRTKTHWTFLLPDETQQGQKKESEGESDHYEHDNCHLDTLVPLLDQYSCLALRTQKRRRYLSTSSSRSSPSSCLDDNVSHWCWWRGLHGNCIGKHHWLSVHRGSCHWNRTTMV